MRRVVLLTLAGEEPASLLPLTFTRKAARVMTERLAHYLGRRAAEIRAGTEGTLIEALESDITRPTPLRGSSIDLIYLSTVFHGFSRDEIPGFLAEVKRLLKPGGRLAIVEIDKVETSFGPPLHLRFSPEDLRREVGLPPLETVAVGPHFYMQIFGNCQTGEVYGKDRLGGR